MGSPNITVALKDNQAAINAVNAACNATFLTLANDEAKPIVYINAHTNGITQCVTKN
jgi:alpha-D-ribose 1-methylphosphonate 5-triphosphate synthase subunit PhnH